MNYPEHVRNFLEARDDLGKELIAQQHTNGASKDIIVVVHNQLECTKNCVESVLKNTEDKFTLWVWDNGSDKDTETYLKEVSEANNGKIKVVRCDENLGFIVPNNRLTEMGRSEFIILLNNDCVVHPKWDKVLVGMLNSRPDLTIVGYGGGLLNEEGMGADASSGEEIDFVMGWCLCMRREDYNKFGLFDENNLKFAYCEDSDLSLRVKENGGKVYAARLNYVDHLGSQTTTDVMKKRDILTSFDANHKYIRERWAHYLAKERILLKKTGVKV